ncbi:hypothetical protein FOS14_13305 [Skermania sp. ID1734]|uniref:hypothetical protein n=1 Tax=Skermania sp. ID1734 TaxID=2597516 RepID=UPI0011800C02|nr:hypothetical protein [Skermania sp. ID1734]TSD99319.1 hypothetical protein FOS14_13305 [Skermania sp. ID1734]
MELAVLVIVVFLLVATSFLALTYWRILHRRRAAATEAISFTFDPSDVLQQDSRAYFFGLASDESDDSKFDGNGALVLSKHVLWFKPTVAGPALRFPLSDIRRVELVSPHTTKALDRPLLRVWVLTADGDDSAVWYVHDPDAWIASLKDAVS